jgi:outer membrane protein assembly factor BamB
MNRSGQLLFALIMLLVTSFAAAEDWPRFRGPNGSGLSTSSDIPSSWSDEENVKWKIDLPGPGGSSPIVFGDRIYLTYYTGYGLDKEEPGNAADLKRYLACYNKSDGALVWHSDVPSMHDEDPYEGFITEHGYASCTPVTDGERIYVMFGKTGVVAFDKEGRKLWLTNVGTDSDPYKWGNGGSCILVGDLLVVNAANVGNSIVGLRTSDGSVAWKYEDADLTNCWSTPIVVHANGRDEIVTCVPGKILALDPASGEEIWSAASPIEKTTCASVVEHEGAVFAMGGRAGDAIGVRCGGEGDVSETHTIWREKLRSGIGTPVVKDGHMYWTSMGIAFCASCDKGEVIYKERLPKPAAKDGDGGGRSPTGDYASAIAVGDTVLLTTRSGTTHMVKASTTFEPIRENGFAQDEGPFNGTPAVSDGELFFRSDKCLYCVSSGGA